MNSYIFNSYLNSVMLKTLNNINLKFLNSFSKKTITFKRNLKLIIMKKKVVKKGISRFKSNELKNLKVITGGGINIEKVEIAVEKVERA